MAFIAALQRLFRDYEGLLDNYTSLSAVSSKSKQKDSEMTSTQFFAPTVAPVASKPLGQTSYGCKDNNMCVLLHRAPSVDENTFSNEIACIEARCLTQEQREYWNGVKNLIMDNVYRRPTPTQIGNELLNNNRNKIIDYLYLGKANDTGFIDNYGNSPKTFDTFCVGCGKDNESANFCNQDSILMDIGPDDFITSDGQKKFVNWAVDAIKKINEHISKQQNVSVYYQQGKDRSVAFVATYLFVMTNIPVTEVSENKVYEFLLSKRYVVAQYIKSDIKSSYFNGNMRNLIPMIKLRLFPTILSENNKRLIDIQCLNYNYVMTEGLKDGRKQEHWFWWYFPKTNISPGNNDPKRVIFDNSNQQQVTALLRTCDLDNWCNVINKLAEFLKAKDIPADGGWNTDVLPKDDQDKAYYFIDYFLNGDGKPTIDNNPQFASFKTALKNLARTNRLFSNLEQIVIIHSEFTKKKTFGDFLWMINQSEFSRSLFVFNDNEKEFYEFFNQNIPGKSFLGNAIIRPYQSSKPPRAIGVPTGILPNKGYKILTIKTKEAIDDSMKTLLKLLETGNYDSVIISWDSNQNTLGAGIFNPSKRIKDYIVQQIQTTVASANNKL